MTALADYTSCYTNTIKSDYYIKLFARRIKATSNTFNIHKLMLLIGLIVVGVTILFLLGWTIALLVARKRETWIYAPYEPKQPQDEQIYYATGSITPRPPPSS